MHKESEVFWNCNRYHQHSKRILWIALSAARLLTDLHKSAIILTCAHTASNLELVFTYRYEQTNALHICMTIKYLFSQLLKLILECSYHQENCMMQNKTIAMHLRYQLMHYCDCCMNRNLLFGL